MKRTRLLFPLAAVGFLLLVGFLFWWSRPATLLFQGKTVKTWLLQLAAPEPAARAQAEAAFTALGTNAVPDLVHLLSADDARLRKLVWSPKAPIPRRLLVLLRQRVAPPNAYMIHPAAARALARLGPDAAAAESALVRALQDKVNGTYWEAGVALGRIGKPAVPDLMLALRDRDTLVRCAAAHGLGEAGLEAAPAVPALTQMLRRGTTNEQQIAAQSLAKIEAPPQRRRAR